MGKGSGKGRADCCKNIDSMVYVWLVIIIAVSVIFLLAGVLNVAGDIIPSEQKGGPWYMWFAIVIIILVVFVVAYMMSMQYAESAIASKWAKQDEEMDMGASGKLTSRRI